MRKNKMIAALVAVLAVGVPVAAWNFVKPIRMSVPSLQGVTCSDTVCVDDTSRLGEAKALYDTSFDFVESQLSQFDGKPKIIFCSTQKCYRSFGGGRELAIAFPILGALISPKAWKKHFVSHELIHQLQFQELGSVGTMRDPEWLREGMAYSVSQPPDEDFPERFRTLAEQYEQWASGISSDELWAAAKEI